jgi:hypothetical protein
MDIFDAQSTARWNLLTSILFYESNSIGVRHSIPFGQFDKEEYSTLYHELTHQWCAKSTKLGLFLSYVGAVAFESWKSQPKINEISLTEKAVNVIAAATPLLEGIALYAQLDYLIDVEDDDIFMCPIAITKDYIIPLEFSGTFKEWLWNLRDLAIGLSDREDMGILEALFLDTKRHDLNYYFIGYLYIKSLHAYLTKRCDLLTNPKIFLPLIIKIIFDNPIFFKCFKLKKTEKEIFETIHKDIISIRPKNLEILAHMISMNDEAKKNYYHWDIYKQLSCMHKKNQVIYKFNEVYLQPIVKIIESKIAKYDSIDKTFYMLRASSNILKIFAAETSRNAFLGSFFENSSRRPSFPSI